MCKWGIRADSLKRISCVGCCIDTDFSLNGTGET